jgi:hypothetical protein
MYSAFVNLADDLPGSIQPSPSSPTMKEGLLMAMEVVQGVYPKIEEE